MKKPPIKEIEKNTTDRESLLTLKTVKREQL